jgi:hypothetical protein
LCFLQKKIATSSLFFGVGDLECFFAAQGFEAELKRL